MFRHSIFTQSLMDAIFTMTLQSSSHQKTLSSPAILTQSVFLKLRNCLMDGGYGSGQQTGWGKDKFGSAGQYQVVLKEIDLPVVSNYECQDKLRSTRLGQKY